LCLPFAGLRAKVIILGCGARYGSDNPRCLDYCVRESNNLHSPQITIVQGEHGVLAIWPEAPAANTNISLAHDPDTADVLMYWTAHPPGPASDTIETPALRVGLFPSWPDAARRYRERFEELTGVVPLWKQTPAWIRNIHAVHTKAPGGAHGNPTAEAAAAYYANLAKLVAPDRLLLFYWNGNGIVMHGDHRYFTKLGWPRPHVVDALKKYAFRWMGYHPYLLVIPPHSMEPRFAKAREEHWGMPENYKFQPDYAGPADADAFWAYVRPVCAGRYASIDKAGLWSMHPGSPLSRQYLTHNFGRYCAVHRMDGAYMDVCGADSTFHFAPERQVMNGLNCRTGETQALRDLAKTHPDLARMSEVQSAWTVAHSFYTWEGSSHFTLPRAHRIIDVKVDHPLRTALWGSYCWTREAALEPDEAALIGALPDLELTDPWSVARAQLFTREQLFNDLPETWAPDALAYYRSADDRWFQYRRFTWGQAFVELTDSGEPQVRLGQFHGVQRSPLLVSAHVVRWPAYTQGVPFGLNPNRSYRFVAETPVERTDVRVVSLPDGVFVNALRPAKDWCVLELGTTTGNPITGNVVVRPGRKCVGIRSPTKDVAGPFPAEQPATVAATAPGALVLLWTKPTATDGTRANDFLSAHGRITAVGLPDRLWSYNAHQSKTIRTIGSWELPALEVGRGRFRGYAERWVELEELGEPSLRFHLGYPPSETRTQQFPAVVFSVQVNGGTVWQEEIQISRQWHAREVSLQKWNGRTVLVTLSTQTAGNRDITPSHLDPPTFFGRVEVHDALGLDLGN